jgi:hypothetical protein
MRVKNMMLLFSRMIFKLIILSDVKSWVIGTTKVFGMKTPGRIQEAVVLSKKNDTLWKPPSLRHLTCTLVHAGQ